MVDKSTTNEIALETLMKAAGQSFTDAQKALVPNLGVPVNMMLSNAELELKVAVSSDAQGKMSIRPISSDDISRGGIDAGMLSTIRMTFVSSIGELKAEAQSTTSAASSVQESTVPDLTGLGLDKAIAALKSGGWQFEAHAAASKEVALAGTEKLGRVLRQQPSAGQSADKTKTTVHFWVDLGSIPVIEIEGIGTKIADSLSKNGITTVGELSLANVTQIAKMLRISEARAQSIIDMAALMSRLAVAGFKEQVVELIVKGAGIRSIEQLADTDPAKLYRTCQEAITSGKVRVPRGFKLTAEEAGGWIKAAGSQG